MRATRTATATATAAAALLLAGCGGDAPPASNIVAATPTPAATPATPTPAPPPADAAAPVERETPALAVDGEGLRLFDRVTGSASPLPFGTPRTRALAALAFLGAPDTGTNGECGAGPLQYANWPDGLGLFFQDDTLAGWTLGTRGKGGVATAAGIGPGSTRAALEDAYVAKVEQTTLGTEFTTGGVSGLLDGKGQAAKITDMWAGVSCVFR